MLETHALARAGAHTHLARVRAHAPQPRTPRRSLRHLARRARLWLRRPGRAMRARGL